MRKWAKLSASAGVAFTIGFGASAFGIAAPAPPALPGALLVMALTAGYVGADRYFGRRLESREICGGPDGVVCESGRIRVEGEGS